MAPQIKNVIILGASGRVGKVFLPLFLKSGLNVTVFTRPESKPSFPDQVNVIKANYEAVDLQKAFTGQDAVVSLVGHEALGQSELIVDAAVAAGVKWFIPSEFGNDTSNPEMVKRVPMFESKVAVTKYLASKEKEGLSWTAFITNVFFDFAVQVGFLGFDLSTHTARIWDNGNAKFTTATLPAVGDAVVNLLTSPGRLDAAKNRHVYISSFTTSQNEILAALEKVTAEKWTVRERVEGAKAEEAAAEKVKAGDHFALIDQIGAPLLREDLAQGDNSERANRDNALLLPGNKQNVEDELRKLVEGLKK